MDAVTALPSLARGMLDGITRRIGLTVGKGPPFVYLPSWVPTDGGMTRVVACKLLDILGADRSQT